MPSRSLKDLKCLRLVKKPDRVDAVFKSPNGHINTVLLSKTFPPLCSCEWYNTREELTFCKHIDGTFQLLKYPTYTTGERNMALVRTHLKAINDIFGGLPQSELWGICGEPAIGKTRLLVTMAVSIMKITGKNVLYIGTEGAEFINGVPRLFNKIKEEYELDAGTVTVKLNFRDWIKKRRQINSDKDLAKHAEEIPHTVIDDTTTSDNQQALILLSTPKMHYILALLGVYSEKSHSKGGKVVLLPQPDWDNTTYIWDTPFGKFVEAYNLEGGMFILDSLTMMVDPEFVGANQSFPGRSSTNMLICSILDTAALEYDMFGIASHHLTRNPTNQYDKGKPTGGKGVGHNFKYMAYVKKAGQKGQPQRRSIEGLRIGQDAPPSSVVKRFDLMEFGVKDVA